VGVLLITSVSLTSVKRCEAGAELGNGYREGECGHECSHTLPAFCGSCERSTTLPVGLLSPFTPPPQMHTGQHTRTCTHAHAHAHTHKHTHTHTGQQAIGGWLRGGGGASAAPGRTHARDARGRAPFLPSLLTKANHKAVGLPTCSSKPLLQPQAARPCSHHQLWRAWQFHPLRCQQCAHPATCESSLEQGSRLYACSAGFLLLPWQQCPPTALCGGS